MGPLARDLLQAVQDGDRTKQQLGYAMSYVNQMTPTPEPIMTADIRESQRLLTLEGLVGLHREAQKNKAHHKAGRIMHLMEFLQWDDEEETTMKENKKLTKKIEKEKKSEDFSNDPPKPKLDKKSQFFQVKISVDTGLPMTKKKLAKQILRALPENYSGVYIEVKKEKVK